MKYLPIPFCAALAAFFAYFPITDTDIFWHLAAGREMIAHKHFLFTDPFSFTLASPKWIDLHWLFELVVYGLYLLGGLKAILAFKLAVVACVSATLCLIFRSGRYICMSALCAALLFYQARYLILDRPVLVTMLCMSSYLFLFENVRQGLDKRWLWLCIPLQIIWTNSQGLYPIGLFIIGAYLAERLAAGNAVQTNYFPSPSGKGWLRAGTMPNNPSKTLFTAVFLASCASCIVNPYAISGILLPFKLFSRIAPDVKNIYSLNISENVPLFSLTGFEAGYRLAVIATALAVCALFLLNRKRARIAHALLFAGFLYLAYSAVRNVLLYFMIIVPIIAWNLANLDVISRLNGYSPRIKRLLKVGATLAGLGVLAIPLANHAEIVSTYPPHRDLSPFRFPEKIVDYLKANPVPGEMFNDIRYGGYLIWELYPAKKVFIDGRLVIRSERFFTEYLAICEQPELMEFVIKKFNITQAILPWAIFDRYRKLIRWFYQSPDWHLECTDGASFLFVKNDASHRPAINLSDSNAVKAIADGIRMEWKDAPAVRQEALGYFEDALDYVGASRAPENSIEH